MRRSDAAWSRRSLLGAGLAVVGTAVLPEAGWCRADERRLQFVHLHTDEKLDVVYYAGGRYLPSELLKVDYFMRDWRENQATRIDHNVLDFLFAVQAELGAFTRWEVLCGYRTPATNEMLRRRSRGVAKRSYHLVGRALDVNLPRASLTAVRAKALDLERGGVGFYPSSHFVHLDTGGVRSWRG
jgi:uncharacterized protein YcbK (DUF882 family)